MITVEAVSSVTPELLAAFERLMPQSHPALPLPTLADLELVVSSDATTLLVALGEDRQVLGTATVVIYRTPARLHARLENVVVDEPARGQGAGEALTREAVRLAQAAGASVIELNTNPRRESANRLYQRVGFDRHHTNAYWIKF